MHAALPAALDSATLSRRLGELAGDERALQVEFLLHLEEFDRRRAYIRASKVWLGVRASPVRRGALAHYGAAGARRHPSKPICGAPTSRQVDA